MQITLLRISDIMKGTFVAWHAHFLPVSWKDSLPFAPNEQKHIHPLWLITGICGKVAVLVLVLSFKNSPGIRDPLPLEWIITPVRLLTWLCSKHQISLLYVCGEPNSHIYRFALLDLRTLRLHFGSLVSVSIATVTGHLTKLYNTTPCFSANFVTTDHTVFY